MFKAKLRYLLKLCIDGRRRMSSLKPPLNVLFLGSDDFSVAALKILHQNSSVVNKVEVVCVVGKKICPVQRYAIVHDLRVHSWPHLPSLTDYHVGVVASFGHLLPESLISSFPGGILNIHGSLLPRWRGAAPVAHAILAGDTVTGVTIMSIKPKRFDIGDILMQESCKILEEETVVDLTKKLADMGARLLIKCLEDLPRAIKNRTPQPKQGSSKAPKLDKSLGLVSWDNSCDSVMRQWRALQGQIYSETTWCKKRVRLHLLSRAILLSNYSVEASSAPKLSVDLESSKIHSQAKIVKHVLIENAETAEILEAPSKPGQLLYLHKYRSLLVRCSDGWLSVQKLAIEGKKIMNPVDFQNGFLSKVPEEKRVFGT